jgi:hypothetical protein
MKNVKEFLNKDLIWIRIKKYIYLLLFFITILVVLLFLLIYLVIKIYINLNQIAFSHIT